VGSSHVVLTWTLPAVSYGVILSYVLEYQVGESFNSIRLLLEQLCIQSFNSEYITGLYSGLFLGILNWGYRQMFGGCKHVQRANLH